MKSKLPSTATWALLLIAAACGQPGDTAIPLESSSGLSASSPEARFTLSDGHASPNIRFINDSRNASAYLWDFGDGTTGSERNPSHTYTQTGIFPVKLTVFDDSLQSSSFMQKITIEPYQSVISDFAIEPDEVVLTPTQTQRFTVAAYDQFRIRIQGLDFRWSATDAGSIDSTGLFAAGTTTGSFLHSVKVEATLGGVSRIATASVNIEPGPLHHVVLEPQFVELDIGGSQSFAVAGFDQFGNEIDELSLEWMVPEGGRMDASGAFTAETKAGTFQAIANATHHHVSLGAAAAVVIRPDPLDRIVIVPGWARLTVGGTQRFAATALDRYGNEITDVSFSWSASEPSGLIDEKGNFNASTRPGQYTAALHVQAVQGDRRREASAPLILDPGPLASLSVHPAVVELAIGDRVTFSVSPLDQYGNEISGLPISYLWPEALGNSQLRPSGQFIAGTTAGTFPIPVAVRQRDVERVALIMVTIHPGSIDRVVVEPPMATIDAGATRRFVFKALDAHGNEINGLPGRWSADFEAGSVDSSGMFTATGRAGTYPAGVRVDVGVANGDLILVGVAEVRLIQGLLGSVYAPPTQDEPGAGLDGT